MTQMYGVIGDPIAHSLSPLIHNEWLREHDIDATYKAMQVPAGELEDALATLTRVPHDPQIPQISKARQGAYYYYPVISGEKGHSQDLSSEIHT